MGLNHFLVNKGLTLTNQTSAPSNPVNGDIYYDATLQVFRFYENGQWINLGSGSGSGSGINYLAQTPGIAYNFEFNNVTGWSTYLNTAGSGATPDVSPSGSPSPNFTFASTSSTPLRGTYSGLITKDAANRQGHGIRTIAFNIDNEDVGKTLYVSMDFSTSTNYLSGDMQVFITDGTSIINVVNPSIAATNGSNATLITSFVATTSTSYKLIVHVAGTNALAWTVKVDSFSVGPQVAAVVPAVSDWQSFTMNITGSVSNPTKGTSITVDEAKWRRVGDSMEIRWNYAQSSGTGGSAGSGTYLFALPTGYIVDTSKLSSSGPRIVGHGSAGNSSNNEIALISVNTDQINLIMSAYKGSLDATSAISSTNFPLNAAANYTIIVIVPIANWTTGIQVVNTSSEYAWNSGSNTSAGANNNSTTAGNGPQGTPVLAVNSTTSGPSWTTFNVQFVTPIQASDSIFVEIMDTTQSVPVWKPISNDFFAPMIQGTFAYGIQLGVVSSTQVEVLFGNGGLRPGATYAVAGGGWSAATGYNWRVRKTAGASMVGVDPDQIGKQMSSIGANAILSTFTSIPTANADLVASAMNSTGANTIASTMTSTGADSIFSKVDAAGLAGITVSPQSYTPVVSVNAGTVTNPLVSGAYYKIGKFVWVTVEGSWTPGVSGTATEFFVTLPFTIGGTLVGFQYSQCWVQVANTATNLGSNNNFVLGFVDTAQSGSQLIVNFANKVLGTVTSFAPGSSPQFGFSFGYFTN